MTHRVTQQLAEFVVSTPLSSYCEHGWDREHEVARDHPPVEDLTDLADTMYIGWTARRPPTSCCLLTEDRCGIIAVRHATR
jgi:hypothetical protein